MKISCTFTEFEHAPFQLNIFLYPSCYLLARHVGEEILRDEQRASTRKATLCRQHCSVKFELRNLKNEETGSISFFPIPISACPLVFTALHQTVFDYRLIYNTARFGQYIFVVTSNYNWTSVIALTKHSSNSRIIFSFCRTLF